MNKKNKRRIKKLIYYSRYWYRLFLATRVKKTVIVLGMHRSGTSLVAGILNKLDINMGKYQIKADSSNKKGHYENIIIKYLNEKILTRAGGSWKNPPQLSDIIRAGKGMKKQIRRIIKIEESVYWGWKDPRTVLTLPLFIGHLKNPHFIICERDDEEIAYSLCRRNNFNIQEAKELIRTYKNQLNKFVNKTSFPVLRIPFNDFFEKSSEILKKISEFLDIEINPTKKKEILNFIDPELRTFSSKNDFNQ